MTEKLQQIAKILFFGKLTLNYVGKIATNCKNPLLTFQQTHLVIKKTKLQQIAKPNFLVLMNLPLIMKENCNKLQKSPFFGELTL